MATKEELEKLILDSAIVSKNYCFVEDIPKAPNPLKLSKWYASEVLEISGEIDTLENNHNAICTCKKGCSECCSQLIAVNNPERVVIEFALQNLSKEIKVEIKEIVKSQCETLKENNFSRTSLDSLFMTKEKEQSLQKDFFSFKMKCPFLNNDLNCMIYEVRPTVCWSYRNYGNPEACKDNWDILTTLKYDDWEKRFLERLYVAKKPKRNEKLQILQFFLEDILF